MAGVEWRIDQPALQRLARRVGLKHPVRARRTSYPKSGYGGRYTGFRNGCHHIVVEKLLFRGEALRVLLHELCHAVQTERVGSDADHRRLWMAEMEELGITKRALTVGDVDWDLYNLTPMEREANDFADEWLDDAGLDNPIKRV